jgi:hypothetical protein
MNYPASPEFSTLFADKIITVNEVLISSLRIKEIMKLIYCKPLNEMIDRCNIDRKPGLVLFNTRFEIGKTSTIVNSPRKEYDLQPIIVEMPYFGNTLAVLYNFVVVLFLQENRINPTYFSKNQI